MKHLLYNMCSAFALVVALGACEHEYEPINNLAECSWHLSSEHDNRLPIIVRQNQHLSLMDISQGEIEHVWEVSDNGTYMLRSDVKLPNQVDDYEPYIDYSAPHTSHDETIHVLFRNSGQHTIRLRNVFERPTSYTYTLADVKHTVYTKEENGVYVMDTTFVIDVYETIMQPYAKIYRDKECTQEIETGVNEDGSFKSCEIEYGDKLYMVDASYDRPNSWTYTCQRANLKYETTDHSQPVGLEIKKLTLAENVNEAPLNIIMSAERLSDPNNKYIPSAFKKDTILPLNIIVKPSTKPLEYTIEQIDQNNLKVVLSNSMFVKGFTDASKVSLKYTNTYNGKSVTNRTDVPISKVALDSKEQSTLIITTDEKIYNTDDLYLTVSGITLFDGNVLNIPEPAEANVKTTFVEYINEDFSDGIGEWKVVPRDNILGDNGCDYEIVEENGNKYLKLNNASNDNIAFTPDALISKVFNISAGKYITSYKYKVLSSTRGGGGIKAHVIRNNGVNSDGKENPWHGSVKDWCDLPSGTIHTSWRYYNSVTNSQIYYEGKTDSNDMSLSLEFNGFSGVICIDDIFFGYIEVRP